MKSRFLPASALAALSAAFARAAPDRSARTVFNPTPRDQRRELSTDRPDQTESPRTMGAGHWQFESDFANCILDRVDGARTRTLNLAPVNVMLGLANVTDLRFVFDSYTREKIETAGAAEATDDRGDLTLRLKHALGATRNAPDAQPFAGLSLRY